MLTKNPREENSRANALSRVRSGTEQVARIKKYKILIRTEPVVSTVTELMQVKEVEPIMGNQDYTVLETWYAPSDEGRGSESDKTLSPLCVGRRYSVQKRVHLPFTEVHVEGRDRLCLERNP